MKPLYIASRKDARISVQGPALRIDSQKRAPAVMAMRHISRIICSDRTQWTRRALSQCMEAGVPVVFTRKDGTVNGFLHGTGAPPRSTLFDRLKELLTWPEGERIYRTWFRAMESRRRTKMARCLRIPADRHRCRTLRRAMKKSRRQRAPEPVVQYLETSWGTALAAFVNARLALDGLTAGRQRVLWPRMDLITDMIRLLEWELHLPGLAELNRASRDMQSGQPMELIHARILARFHCHESELQDVFDNVMHRLDIRLLEEGLA